MASAPSIPPRPSRTKDTEPPATSPSTIATAPSVPAIPPRPKRGKSPMPVDEAQQQEQIQTPELEPEITTISPSTELHAPVARVPLRPPVRKNTGIPQIGRRVPMYPNAGDVQAPSPAATPGGGRKAHVYREEWEMDEGAYGTHGAPRINPHARSSSDLNQSVALGLSTPETSTPVPDEEIGYLATEQYARVISPQHTGPINSPGEDDSLTRVIGDSSVEIHLDPAHHHLHNHHPHRAQSSRPGTRPGTRPASPTKHHDGDDEGDEDDGNDTETEKEHEHPILASDEVLKRAGGFMLPAVSPPLAAWRPASTANSRPQSVPPGELDDDEDGDVEPARLSGRGFESRESLVRSSLESGERPEPLFPESDDEAEAGTKTPAENKSHEKLKRPGMPESMGSSGGHKFPSKDVWEEAPEFSQLEATVSSTPPPADTEMTDEEREADRTIPKREDGKSERELAYIQGQPNEHYTPGDEMEFERKQKEALKKTPEYRHHVDRGGRDDGLDRLLKRGTSTDDPDKLGVSSGRVGVKRFPSNDIWEDVPPSLQLSAEIENLQAEEPVSVTEQKERATTSGSTKFEDPTTVEDEKRPTTGAPIEGAASSSKPELPARPTIPSARPPPKERKLPPATIPQPPERPQASVSTSPAHAIPPPFTAEQPVEKKQPPGVPGRPKPKVALKGPIVRPSATAGRSSSTDAVPTAPKPKPTVPPRTGGKIAALKAGLLSDLNNQLKLGPQAPKKVEEEQPASPEKKKEVLPDVRKSRAKGPKGRKLPTATTTISEPAKVAKKKENMVVVGVWTVWSVSDGGAVEVLTDPPAEKPAEKKQEEEKEKEPEIAKEPKAAEEVPVPTTSTLPDVSRTGIQAVPSVPTDAKEAEDAPVAPTAAAEEREQKGTLQIITPLDEHPEDATPAAAVEVEESSIAETEKGRVDATDEVAVAGGDVSNTEGDTRVEI